MMIYQLQLVKGLLRPTDSFYRLEQAETIRGLWSRFSLLVFFSVLISFVSGYLGVQAEPISTYITKTNPTIFEWEKMLFAIGAAVWGLIYPLVIIFIPTLLFWTFLEVDFRKLIALQTFVYLIYLIEFCLLIGLQLFLAIPRASSPFTLGVLAQYVTDNQLVINFFSFISLFQLWAFVLQYQFLKGASAKSPRYVFLLIMIITLVFWVFATLFTSIHVERLF
ncbi:hypothetical protein [Bacillus sp. FJAT-52991]|uniref:Yip1 domain-containing protein n=1 Tax=Bacillus kandeliae TaxID=3129297 RepID=A0ABZ2N605_9BACI